MENMEPVMLDEYPGYDIYRDGQPRSACGGSRYRLLAKQEDHVSVPS